MGGINEFGTQEQKERFLPGMAKGKILGAFGLTERMFSREIPDILVLTK